MTARQPGRRRAGRGARDFRNAPAGWLRAAPAVLIFAACAIIRAGRAFCVSLRKQNMRGPGLPVFRGPGNYRAPLTAAGPGSAASLWREAGFFTVVFPGVLAVISGEYGEAARADGCGPRREFSSITWPRLRPVWRGITS